MGQLTSEQAHDLANQLLGLAQSIGDFRYEHWTDLSKSQHQLLANQHWSVLIYGEDILTLSTALVMDDLHSSLASIKMLTGQIKATLNSLNDIQEGITIAASIVTLGAAIVNKNPMAIEDAIEDLVKTANT